MYVKRKMMLFFLNKKMYLEEKIVFFVFKKNYLDFNRNCFIFVNSITKRSNGFYSLQSLHV